MPLFRKKVRYRAGDLIVTSVVGLQFMLYVGRYGGPGFDGGSVKIEGYLMRFADNRVHFHEGNFSRSFWSMVVHGAVVGQLDTDDRIEVKAYLKQADRIVYPLYRSKQRNYIFDFLGKQDGK